MAKEVDYEKVVEKYKYWLERQIDDMEYLLKSTQDEKMKLQRDGSMAFLKEAKRQLTNIIGREKWR